MKKITSKEIKKAIIEQAYIYKRKQEIYSEVTKMNTELKKLDEHFTGTFGFAVDGDKANKSKTGFVNPQDISHVSRLEREMGPDNEEKIEETEKWAKEVPKHKGKMHDILGIPEGEKVEDHYKSGESLANALVSKVGKKEAAGMLAFAANVDKSKNIFDSALKHIS
jgi:hypothetical protein